MTDKQPQVTLQEEIASALGSCTCDEAYKTRNLTAPDCACCNFSEGVEELLEKKVKEALELATKITFTEWSALAEPINVFLNSEQKDNILSVFGEVFKIEK